MKKFLFTILFSKLASGCMACGFYYPYGEDARFSILNPNKFLEPGFSSFAYGFYHFQVDSTSVLLGQIENAQLWQKHVGKSVSVASIIEAVYGSSSDLHISNAFIAALKAGKHTEALNYLAFAKQLSRLTSKLEDPWERGTYSNSIPGREKFIQKSLTLAYAARHPEIKRRYLFLALRLAWYNGNNSRVQKIFKQLNSSTTKKDILYYWSLYFRALAEVDHAKANQMLSEVFVNAPDKRFAVWQNYYFDVSLTNTIKFAGSRKEKATAIAVYAMFRPDKQMLAINKVQSYDPSNKLLPVLIVRELNKYEDWIFTQYYSDLDPALYPQTGTIWGENSNGRSFHLRQVRKERREAAKFRAILRKRKSIGSTADLYAVADNYLEFMSETLQPDSTLSVYTERQPESAAAKDQFILLDLLRKIRMARDTFNFSPEHRKLLIRKWVSAENRSLFAVARELEFKGFKVQAAAIFSLLKQPELMEDAEHSPVMTSWKSIHGIKTLFIDAYDNYFFYLDAEYSIEELFRLIKKARSTNSTSDTFERWMYSVIRKDNWRLNDLLGTKYLRADNLGAAKRIWSQLPNEYWNDEEYYYREYLTKNPFYLNFPGEQKVMNEDLKQVNKYTVVTKLLQHIRATQTSKANRDYHFFVIANCYFNMSYYGNAWMMKRYSWSLIEEARPSKLWDDANYYTCSQAKRYYLKALSAARNKKFKALCLKMAMKCDAYKASFSTEKGVDETLRDLDFGKAGPNLRRLTRKYSSEYNELGSGCESFSKYFQQRTVVN